MRGPLLDTRLEAIAGMPVVDVTTQVIVRDIPTATTIVVGEYLPLGRQQILFYQGVPHRFSANVSASEHLTLDRFFGAPFGTTYAVWGFDPITTGYIGGVVASNNHWYGPMRALVYDRALTDYQIKRVIQYLMRNLK